MRKRYSIQRAIILSYLQNNHIHPCADMVYNGVREQIPNISLGTVYRNLNDMVESGEIRRVCVSANADRFDGNIAPHYHMVCQSCGKVEDLHEYFQELQQVIAEHTDYKVLSHQINFNVICPACQKEADKNEITE